MDRRYLKYLVIGLIIAIVSALMLPQKEEERGVGRDYDAISEEGILRVTMSYAANSYHVGDDGEPDGYHYRLVRDFAEEHGLRLEVIPEMDVAKQEAMLAEGRCDLIADGHLLTEEYDTIHLQYTRPVRVDRLLLVQRKAGVDSLCTHLRSQIELAGQTVCIPENSPFKQRIRHIMEEIGDSIYVDEIPRYGQEQLMAMVAHGDICYAICEKEVVNTHISRFPQLDVSLPVGFNQFYSWAVGRHAPALLDSINLWLSLKHE
ncbi:MAG: transporter substrate-binding domain-containing protein [Bacteroidaceae bacterium]|nr:transporter substrate-binding domain-containing protein [Bacteroidaceae bacterium]